MQTWTPDGSRVVVHNCPNGEADYEKVCAERDAYREQYNKLLDENLELRIRLEEK